MGIFNTVHFIEHINNDDDSITDTRIIIIYDEEDENFYYYGTRNNENRNKYINYNGKFHYTRLNSLVSFITCLVDNFKPTITTEFNQIYIPKKHYYKVDYPYIKSKLNVSSELVAFDTQYETFETIYSYLEMLITHKM